MSTLRNLRVCLGSSTCPELNGKQISLLQNEPQTHRTTGQRRNIRAPGPPDDLLNRVADLGAAIRQRKTRHRLAVGVLDFHPQTAASAGRVVDAQLAARQIAAGA